MRRILVITGYGKILKKGERLEVVSQLGTSGVPIRYLDFVVVMGKVSLSGEAVDLLLKNRIPIFFLSRFGSVKGMLLDGILASNYTQRLAQFEAKHKKELELARYIVLMKIREIEEAFRLDLKDLKERLPKSVSLEEILGVEGEASKRMFSAFRENIKGCGLKFAGRKYRPPSDEVNAVLSLTYTLAYCLALPLVIFIGYDPYISFLHTKRGTHASFCSDVIEPARPFLTKRLEWLLLQRSLGPKDFNRSGKGVYLGRSGVEKLLNWFESIKEELTQRLKETITRIGEEL